MTETTEKKVAKVLEPIDNASAAERIEQSKRIEVVHKDPANLRKFVSYTELVSTDDEAKSRYNCTIAHLVGMGIRTLMYGIKGDAIKAALNSGDSASVISDTLQAMVDEHRVPDPTEKKVRVPSKVKEKAQAVDGMVAPAEAAGFTDPAMSPAERVTAWVAWLQAGKPKKFEGKIS